MAQFRSWLSGLSYSVWELCSSSNIRAADTNLQYLLYPCMEEDIVYYLFEHIFLRQLKDNSFSIWQTVKPRGTVLGAFYTFINKKEPIGLILVQNTIMFLDVKV